MNKGTRSYSTQFFIQSKNAESVTLYPLKSQQLASNAEPIRQKLFTNISQFNQTQPLFQPSNSNIKRNKSSSQSKSSLFSKAHSVNRHQSLLVNKDGKRNSDKSHFPLPLKLHKKDRQQQTVDRQMQRRLIIKKVLADKQSQKPRLTLRGELQKLQKKTKLSNQLQTNGQKMPMSNSELSYSQLDSALRRGDKATNPIERSSYSENEGLASPKQLSFSFVEHKKEQPLTNKAQQFDTKMKNNSQLSNESAISKQSFNQYAKELSQAIQASIKQQFQQIYKEKQKYLQQKYQAKEEQYLQKINKTFQSQLQKQRKQLLERIGEQVQGKLSKMTIQTQKMKKQPSSHQQMVEQPTKTIQSSIKSTNVQTRVELPSKNTQNKVRIHDDQRDIPQVRLLEKKDPIKNETIKQIKMVQKQKSTKSVVSAQNNVQKAIQNKLNHSKNTKQQNQSIFQNADSSLIDQITQINLNSQRKDRLSPKNQPLPKQKDNKVNKTFDDGKKLNDSFERKKEVNRDLQRQTERSENSLIPKQLKRKGSEQEVDKKRREAERAERAEVKTTLLQLNKNDNYLTFIGQAFAYCSKFNKKSRVQWRVPSLFLYRYCYDSYRNFTSIYQKGVKMGLIKPEDCQKFQNDNNIIKQNLEKILKIVIKKVELTQLYRQILMSAEIELKRLYKVLKIEVKKYALRLKESEEVSGKGDENVARCGLRIMYSWLIILWLQGRGRQVQVLQLDELKGDQLLRLFDETFASIQQSQ